MNNVAAFDEFDSDLDIDAHSRGLPRIVLEGMTDVWLFRDIWFTNYLAKFDFVPASLLADGDGCTAVPAAVNKSWDMEIPAFGILDRDVYFRRKVWDALYEPQEQRFRDFEANDNLFVSELWEIEAHLILPDLLEAWVIGCSRDAVRYGHLATGALDRALTQCDILFEAAPYLAGMHADGKGTSGCFGEHDIEHVREICANGLQGLSEEARAQAGQVQAHIAALREVAPTEPAARLRYFLKFIDTKRLLNRLRAVLRLNPQHDTQQMLAAFMRQAAQEPQEFTRHLDALIERTRAT